MTVSSETWRLEYAGNGVTTAFTTPQFLALADIKVYLVDDSDGSSVTWALTTDYTLTGAGSASGTVTAIVAPAADFTLVIVSDPAITQAVDYVENDPFPAASHEGALDKLTLIVRRLAGRITRSLQLADSDTSGASTTMPVPVALEALRWNAAGTAIETFAPGDVALATPGDNTVSTAKIVNKAVTLAKIQDIPQYKMLARNSPGDGDVQLYDCTQAAFNFVSALSPGARLSAVGAFSRVVANRTTSITIATATIVDVVFNTVVDDNIDDYNEATGVFTSPADGWYRVSASAQFTSGSGLTGTDSVKMELLPSAGTSVETFEIWSSLFTLRADGIFRLLVGQTIKCRISHTGGSNRTVDGACYLSISRTLN